MVKISKEGKSQCICVGSDKNNEWMLPWWWKNFFHYNNPEHFNIVFGDYGMSKEAIRTCERIGEVIDMTYVSYTKNWFKKPEFMTKINYDKFIYMDSDCQILRNLGPMFDLHIDDDTFIVTRDVPTQFNTEYIKKPVQTGVIVSSPKNKLILDWTEQCKKQHDTFRGDQEILNWMFLDYHQRKIPIPSKIKIVNQRYQWLRLNGKAPSDTYIYHWTGRIGKDEIRKQMKEYSE